MFRHVVLFQFVDGVTEEQRRAVRDGLAALRDTIPTVRDLTVGEDAGLAADNHDMALVVDFDDRDGYARYRDDPGHQRLVAERIRPVVQRRTAVQYAHDDMRTTDPGP